MRGFVIVACVTIALMLSLAFIINTARVSSPVPAVTLTPEPEPTDTLTPEPAPTVTVTATPTPEPVSPTLLERCSTDDWYMDPVCVEAAS